MRLSRVLAAAAGLILPLVIASGADAAAHRRHPAAHVRTATYRVAPHAPRPHRLHTQRHTRPAALAQRHRPASSRRG